MALPVFLTDQAHEDVDSTCVWWEENRSAEQADRWYQKLVTSIDALKSQPERFAAVEESAKMSIKLRQVNFGSGKKWTHRIVYSIRPDMVLVLRVLHLSRRELSVEDL